MGFAQVKCYVMCEKSLDKYDAVLQTLWLKGLNALVAFMHWGEHTFTPQSLSEDELDVCFAMPLF
jgi:hypothetical protein